MNYANQVIERAFSQFSKEKETVEPLKKINFTEKDINSLKESAKNINIVNTKEIVSNISLKDISWIDFGKSAIFSIDFLKTALLSADSALKPKIREYLDSFNCKTQLRVIIKDYESDILDRPRTEDELRKVIKPYHEELNNLILMIISISELKEKSSEIASIKEEFPFDKVIKNPPKKKNHRRKSASL